jgi:hypothetical protein
MKMSYTIRYWVEELYSGAELYSGTKQVVAAQDEEAYLKAKEQVARDMLIVRDSISARILIYSYSAKIIDVNKYQDE